MKPAAKELARRMTRREALGLVGAALAAACFSERPTDTGNGGEGSEVEMTDQLTFSPQTLTVAVGETVVWRNTSSLIHTATGDPSRAADPSRVALPAGAEPWDSGTLSPGGSYSRTFDVPGEYRYVCLPHENQGMLGRVVVTSS